MCEYSNWMCLFNTVLGMDLFIFMKKYGFCIILKMTNYVFHNIFQFCKWQYKVLPCLFLLIYSSFDWNASTEVMIWWPRLLLKVVLMLELLENLWILTRYAYTVARPVTCCKTFISKYSSMAACACNSVVDKI